MGRKLDFLTQELNRETNTIGSKCQDLDITRTVVDMKAGDREDPRTDPEPRIKNSTEEFR